MKDDHDFEPAYGLPELLPPGERLLWQGSPDWRALARELTHARGLSLYFAALLLWRGASSWSDGATALQAAGAALVLLPIALLALGLLLTLAWLCARTSVYTITDQRVVLRIGIVLSLTFNLPYRRIEAAQLRAYGDGCGDISLTLAAPDQIAYLHLWPHARPWRLKRSEPMLRCVPDAQRVATLLSAALAASADQVRPVRAEAVPASRTRAGHPALVT